MALSPLHKALGGLKSTPKIGDNEFAWIEAISGGFPMASLLSVWELYGLTAPQMAAILPVSERTLVRWREQKTLKDAIDSVTSEHVLDLAKLWVRGIEVFKDRNKFLNWLDSASRPLQNKTPLSLLNTRFGLDLVNDELGRIEHGVFI